MRSIRPEELGKNVFHMIGKEWLLVTAEKEGKVNTMTASWGGLGVMWGKNVAYIVLRPQRYTKEFVDAGGDLFPVRSGRRVPQDPELSGNRVRTGRGQDRESGTDGRA